MRKFHRWVSTFAMVFLAWVGITGVLLAVDSMWPPAGIEQQLQSAQASASMPSRAALETFESLLAAALQGAPEEVQLVDVQLQNIEGRTVVAIGFGNDVPAQYFDAKSGEPVAAPAPPQPTSWINNIQFRLRIHNLLQDLHRGSIIGIPGQIIDVLTGLCFIFLSVTGSIMYFELLKRRRKTGKKALFWR